MAYTIVMACFCIAIAIVDFKTYRIPDTLLILFAIVMVILEGGQLYTLLALRFASAAISFLLFGAVWRFTRGIGFGDVKYAALLGFLLGPDKLIIAFIASALLGVFVYLTGVILFHWPKTKKIPYAPILSAGTIISLPVNFNLTGGVV
jgi:prepilin signal peptidase PulO-like enzyme (type II secretory pathway)